MKLTEMNLNDTLLFLITFVSAAFIIRFITLPLTVVYCALVILCYSITKNMMLSLASTGVVCFIVVYLNGTLNETKKENENSST